jgi:hypothetical protein
MTRHEVLEMLRPPQHTEVRRDVKKPVESWFYGRADSYAIVLVWSEEPSVGYSGAFLPTRRRG